MIFRLEKYMLLALVAVTAWSAVCAEQPSAQMLLQRARDPKSASTYGKFYGSLQHRRRGQEPEEIPLYFGVIIGPKSSLGQIVVDNREAYTIRQTRDPGQEGTSVIYDRKTCVTLNRVGLRASDLTMSFLHYELVRELPETTLSAVVSCRVLLLKSPDGKEYVKVYLEKEHAFPLKAEFFNSPEDKKPFRLMEANGFTKKNDLYYAKTLLIEGPGWRTKVEFFPDFVELGMYDKNNPVNVFLPVR